MIHSPFFREGGARVSDQVEVCPGVRMGAHSYMNGGRINSGSYIGRYCSIGYSVTIGVGHHDKDLMSTSPWFVSEKGPTVRHIGDDQSVRVVIKNDVWIGDGVIILNGVTIGNGAVIGAGAVVTHDIPDYAIAIGVPAKIYEMRFDPPTIERLLKLKWWDIDPSALKSRPLHFTDEDIAYWELQSMDNPALRPKFTLEKS